MLSAEQTAEMTGAALSTLYKNWREWGLEAYRIGGRLKFRERDVETWIRAQRVRG